jgi:hypothetical protein
VLNTASGAQGPEFDGFTGLLGRDDHGLRSDQTAQRKKPKKFRLSLRDQAVANSTSAAISRTSATARWRRDRRAISTPCPMRLTSA